MGDYTIKELIQELNEFIDSGACTEDTPVIIETYDEEYGTNDYREVDARIKDITPREKVQHIVVIL